MSHCAPEATLKPKHFEFTPKTVISNVFVVQMYWEAVPNMWPCTSKASVDKCCTIIVADSLVLYVQYISLFSIYMCYKHRFFRDQELIHIAVRIVLLGGPSSKMSKGPLFQIRSG